MKTLMFNGVAVAMFLTVVAPNWASAAETSTSRTNIDMIDAQRLSDLDMKVNPQLGVSNFEYSKGSAGETKTRLSGGATFEFGKSARKIETGLLLIQSGSTVTLRSGERAEINSSYLTIPMMAKLRLLSLKAQSWYAKFGFMPAFEVSSSRDSETNNLDVLTSIGLGGRLYFNRRTDFIVEATYNRGLLDSLKNNGTAYNQGFVVMAGMSFSI